MQHYLWIEYKIEIKKPYKTQKGIQGAYNELLKLSKSDPTLAKLIVEQSISKEWKGLFKLQNNDSSGHSQTYGSNLSENSLGAIVTNGAIDLSNFGRTR